MRSRARRQPKSSSDRRVWSLDESCPIVARRSGGKCEITGCHSPGEQFHHRRPRGMGGSRFAGIHSPSNLLHLCAEHHAWIESHRTESREFGLLVPQSSDPGDVVVVLRHGRVRLTETAAFVIVGAP